MPLVHRRVLPRQLSNKKLHLDPRDSEFIAVNNGTLVSVLRQLASLVSISGEIFKGLSDLTGDLGLKIQSVKLRLEELEVKTELFDPKLIPVPEGDLDLNGNGLLETVNARTLETRFFCADSRPDFLVKLYKNAGSYAPKVPLRCTIEDKGEGSPSVGPSSGCSHVVERDECERREVGVAKKFPGEVLVSVDVTGSIFDRMRANRRSLLIYTKRIRQKKKRRNTICGSLPNKECGIQTSLGSVATPTTTLETHSHRKYAGDSGHWSTSTESRDLQFPWQQHSRSNSSDFYYDEEDRTLTPQLESFTDGMVSDSDSVDTEGYFTSFRNECGFPKLKKSRSTEGAEKKGGGDCDYELFGQGSTSTTASSCGTVVLRQKIERPAELTQIETLQNDGDLEERVKRKSLIERIPSLVVVTPSPSTSSASPPPKDSESSAGSESEDAQTNREEEELLEQLKRYSSYSSSTLSSQSLGSTETLRDMLPLPTLPQPDVIADVYQLTLKGHSSALDSSQEYCSLESPLLGPSALEELPRDLEVTAKMDGNSSARVRGARVVLDADGKIIFSSETLRRKRQNKVSFEPGDAVKSVIYDTLPRERESVYDRLRKESEDADEELYECIAEIRRHNLRESEAASDLLTSQIGAGFQNVSRDISSQNSANIQTAFCDNLSQNGARLPNLSRDTNSPQSKTGQQLLQTNTQYGDVRMRRPLLETDLDSAIPPVMPELKTLPKIKDCLKRNESYRMATDEVKVRSEVKVNPGRSPLDPRWKHRDILEEDPLFIQQVLSFSQEKLASSPQSASKFPVSAEDRPSFLRSRDSPPTMEEISKQIYHFRKKFNVAPIALSTKLASPSRPPLPPPREGPLSLLKASPGPLRETAFTTPFKPCEKPLEPPSSQPFSQRRLFSSLREPKATATISAQAPSDSLHPKTSLSHFKRLLSATARRGSPGRTSTVSAVEVLRPRLLGQETKL